MVNSILFLTSLFKISETFHSLDSFLWLLCAFILFMCECVVLYLFWGALCEVAVNVLNNFCSSIYGKLSRNYIMWLDWMFIISDVLTFYNLLYGRAKTANFEFSS